MKQQVPYFSLVTPMFNRATTIGRAIESALAQTDGDFELLIVDDCSTDDSVIVVRQYNDPRLRLLRHDRNRGPCPARNTAIAAARGHWCVMLDSDFALLPGALKELRARTAAAPADVGNVASSCAWDDGRVTPFPPRPNCTMGFPAFLEWLSTVSVSEKLECIRRSVFDDILYADSRAWEFEFHLDLASRWRIELGDEVLVKVYSDAPNRLTADGGPQAVRRVLDDAPDKLASFESAIARHGDALRQWAPALLSYLRVLAGAQSALTGDRLGAARHAAEVLRTRPWAPAAWSVIGLSLLGPETAAWATVQRRKWRAR